MLNLTRESFGKRLGFIFFYCAVLLILPGSISASVLFDNGPLVTNRGGGAGGADISEVQTALGMTTLGHGCQLDLDYRVTDNFSTQHHWDIETITVYVYQTLSPTTSPINDVRIQILDGSPASGGTVVWGDLTTNRLVDTGWSGIYRVPDNNPSDVDRPIMYVECGVNHRLPPGQYWIEYSVGGDMAYTGPWVAPVTMLGSTTTGDAWRYSGTWNPFDDQNLSTQQGIPFKIEGQISYGGAIDFDDLPSLTDIDSHYPGVTFSPGWQTWDSTMSSSFPPHTAPNVAFTHDGNPSIEWNCDLNELRFHVCNYQLADETWTYTVYDGVGTELDSYTNNIATTNLVIWFTEPGMRRLEITGTGNWAEYHTMDDLWYLCRYELDCPVESGFSQPHDGTYALINGYTSDPDLAHITADNFSILPSEVIVGVRWWGVMINVPQNNFEIQFAPDDGGQPGIPTSIYPVTATMVDTGFNLVSYPLYQFDAALPAPVYMNEGWIIIKGIMDGEVFYWATTYNGDYSAHQTDPVDWMPTNVNMSFCLVTAPLPTQTPTNTPTNTPTWTPTPTATQTDIPTNTPTNTPTHAPTAPTATPTNTPTATPTTGPGTPTFTPAPTQTPGCATMGCTLNMPSNDFGPGDICFCDVHVCNTSSETYMDIPVFVILDVFGSLFFAPSFGNWDYYSESLPPGETIISVLPSFPWPTGAGTVGGIYFYAAMTNPGMTELHGQMDMFEFGWH